MVNKLLSSLVHPWLIAYRSFVITPVFYGWKVQVEFDHRMLLLYRLNLQSTNQEISEF